CSVEACLGDEGVDGILVIYTPLSEFSPNRLAINILGQEKNLGEVTIEEVDVSSEKLVLTDDS
ncbi:hypothetical protein AKJ57_05840, partial [candidate division MSBL1 archaeon SCGC-AAA259A05]